MTLQHEFELYMRHELPLKLNLSKSKQVACEMIFYHFSDSLRELALKSPDEFQYFFENLRNHIDLVAKWKCPRTHIIAPKLTKNKAGLPILVKNNDGKTVYMMYKKSKDAL